MDCFTQEFLAVIAGFIIFVFLTWILVTDLQSLDRSQNPTRENNDTDKSHRQSNTEAAIVEGDIPPFPRNKTSSNSDRQYRLDRRRYIVEILTLFAVVVYGVETYRLLVTTQSATRISAESLTSVQRAFVFPNTGLQAIPFVPAISPDGNIVGGSVWLEWKNTGTTPARRSILNVNLKVMDTLPENFDFPDATSGGGTFTIPPQTVAVGGEVKISVTDFQRLQAEPTKPLYVWGWIKYRDVFPDSRPHLSEFCMFSRDVTGDLRDAKKASVSMKFVACQVHNCSDDDCSDYQTKIAGYK